MNISKLKGGYIMARLNKEQVNEYKQYFLDSINTDGYNFNGDSDKDKINFVLRCFYSEFFNWNINRNKRTVFTEWLQGLPSCINIVFYNYDILQLAEKINKVEYSEKEGEKIILNYFSFMTTIFFKLVKQYKIEI